MSTELHDQPLEHGQEEEISAETIAYMKDWLQRTEEHVLELGADTRQVSNNFNDVVGKLLSVARTDLAVVKRDKSEEALGRLRGNVSLLEDYLMKLSEEPELLDRELEAREETPDDLIHLDIKEHTKEIISN